MTFSQKSKQDNPLSVVDFFTIGIGPSSSHTVGPMRAGYRFAERLDTEGHIQTIARIQVDLYGSLALTGKGHHTDIAIILGLCGIRPRTVDPETYPKIVADVRAQNQMELFGKKQLSFTESQDLIFNYTEVLENHPNGMRFQAFDHDGNILREAEYYSVGGGFVVGDGDTQDAVSEIPNVSLPYPFNSAEELLNQCKDNNLTIAQLVLKNEGTWRSETETREFLLKIDDCMMNCIERACHQTGELPGGLRVKRRANDLYKELTTKPEKTLKDPLSILDWVNLYALAVNEENAAGGRVVTAPTNGAAGVIPAVLKYYHNFCEGACQEKTVDFLATCAAIGMLYKKRASISAAEVGCQGEVGVACSMAAGGLTAVLGGSIEQVENAAEIGMEHNLGLTCDPIGGLVQIPCIERNTMGAVKAINAARLALKGDGTHKVSLDQVIETMRQTGEDMTSKYKETSQGGLAVNVVEC